MSGFKDGGQVISSLRVHWDILSHWILTIATLSSHMSNTNISRAQARGVECTWSHLSWFVQEHHCELKTATGGTYNDGLTCSITATRFVRLVS
jgi:hypothetical protein